MGNMHTAWFRRVAARWTDSLYSVKLATGPMLEAKKLPAESQPLRQELRNDMSITTTWSIALVYNVLGQIPLSQGDQPRSGRAIQRGPGGRTPRSDRFPLLISLHDLEVASQAQDALSTAAELLREGLSGRQ